MERKKSLLILMFFLICTIVLAYGQEQIYKSADGVFQIWFPAAQVQEKTFTTDTPAGEVTSQIVYLGDSSTGKVLYTVTVNVYPNNLEDNSKAVLDSVSQGLKNKDQVIDEQDIFLQDHQGRQIQYKQHPDWSRVEMRAFVVKKSLYVLTADKSNNSEDINKFFNSFQMLK